MVKQKMVIRLSLEDAKKRSKAFKTAVGLPGVTSTSVDGDLLTVVGDGVDSVVLTTMLRKKLGYADLIGVGSAEEKKEEKPVKVEAMANTQPVFWPYHVSMPQSYPYQYETRSRDDYCSIM